MRKKLIFSFLAIAVALLTACVISVMQYRNMSSYVSDLIADDIASIEVAQKLSELSSAYNLDILSVISVDSVSVVPETDEDYFLLHCDRLRASLKDNSIKPLADSVAASYRNYMETSAELGNVPDSLYADSREWFFERLQPRYEELILDIDNLILAINVDLKKNSEDFDSGFYRSIIPGIVALGVAILLLLLLLFFILAYYVNPLYKMLSSLSGYRSFGKKYNYSFEGDDQLVELNKGITDLVAENQRQKHRISELKNR